MVSKSLPKQKLEPSEPTKRGDGESRVKNQNSFERLGKLGNTKTDLKKREKHIRLDLFLVAAVGRNLTLYYLNLVLKNAQKEKSNHKTRIKLLVLSSPICLYITISSLGLL